jgi:serine phosphatase RsbU (regulator of sigma subunit)
MTGENGTLAPQRELDLGARYAATFSAFLAGRGEEALGEAYALGREAVAAQLSVLDLAEAHHRAVGEALRDAATPERRAEVVEAAAALFRESVSTFEIAARGYHEVQEVARLEHEHAMQLRALTEASLQISASLTVEEVLQLTVDAARSVLGVRSAMITASEGQLPTRALVAASPPERLAADVRVAEGALAVTLRDRDQQLGELRVVAEPGHVFSARDEAILAQLGQLASVAVVNAELYSRERRIATTLQRSLLPGTLPTVHGLSAAVRFCPAGDGIEVGGDFYDIFPARDDWAAVIGDVCGKGPEAASVTALARHTLRAAAAFEHRPSRVLSLLHRALRDQRGDGRFCTVAYAHLEVVPRGVRMTLACGGHPLPLVVRADGTVEPVGKLGTLLGADLDTEPELNEVSVDLEEGDALVLYTDGVTEVRRSRREVFGHADLAGLLATCAGLTPDAVAERVERAVLTAAENRPRDDIAILVLSPTR